MDLITQGLLGAALAQGAARREELKLATGIGLVAGVLADADILIRSSGDPLLNLEYHRHFTHALVFVPVGALLAALLAWPLIRRKLRFARVYLFALLGYSLSGVLDASTSYGTHLFWPFSDIRVAWSIISIVDPVFTLVLLLAVLAGLRLRAATPAYVGLLVAGTYMAVGWYQHDRAERATMELAQQRGHGVQRIVVKPTLGNLILWRSVYLSGGHFHVDALRLTPGEQPQIYPGGRLQRIVPEHDLGLPSSSRLYGDVLRFENFSGGYLVRHPRQAGVLGDIRYAMLPDSLEPLWGIKVDMLRPDEHARYETFRDTSAQSRRRFLSMLLGEDP